MKAFKNHFYFRELPLDAPFCDREKVLSDLVSYAESRANVLLYSPRRYGKTSLIKRVQADLAKRNGLVIFTDFFGVTSIDEVAGRFAKAVFEVTKEKDGLFKSAVNFIKTFRPVLRPDEQGGVSLSVEQSLSRRSGLEILDETMEALGKFIKNFPGLINIALDEFQEIVELKEALKIEGILRTHIQRHGASYFFIGSRRRVLLAIFNEKQRPFFQSAINYELGSLPHDELSHFIVHMFDMGGKKCPLELAKLISEIVHQHPYYSQKLAFFIYELSSETINKEEIEKAFKILIDSERPVFEAIVQGLAPKQIALLRAIAKDPSRSVFSLDYMKHHNLGSTGGVQGALKKLSAMDLIEQRENQAWLVVDPVFKVWLEQI